MRCPGDHLFMLFLALCDRFAQNVLSLLFVRLQYDRSIL